MTTAIQKVQPEAMEMAMWARERIDLIKRTVCPKGITDDEFAMFVEQCKRSGLDPLLKQAFCVPRRQNVGTRDAPRWIEKHEFQPSEAGMLARAEQFPDLRGLSAAAVYEKDEIEVDAGAGVVKHRFHPGKQRGSLLGAWALLAREGRLPVVVWLDLGGYQQPTPLWSKIPATMIEKCARVAALRKAYPSAFGGLYIREEMPAEEYEQKPAQSRTVSVRAHVAQVAQLAANNAPPRAVEQVREVVESSLVQEPPPPSDDDAPPPHDEAMAEGSDEPLPPDSPPAIDTSKFTVPFGRDKGTPLPKASKSSLEYLKRVTTESINDAGKVRFREKNEALLAAVDAELASR